MAKFKVRFKGYDRKEVDAYLHKTTEYHESRLRELEECVKRFKEENDYLYAKNSEYHRNEERVSGAIVKAMEVKNNLERDLKKKIALEEDRLRLFKTKWLAYVKGINRSNADRVLEDAQGYIDTFRREFGEKATRELDLPDEALSAAERSYYTERERLAAIASDLSSREKENAAFPPGKRERENGELPQNKFGEK